MKMGVILTMAAGALAAIVMAAVIALRSQRASEANTLERHPERLEQMLDATDDA
jgi:hypothetical protein